MRMIVKDTLTRNGFEICGEAPNGVEAVTKEDGLQAAR
jgi:hypothetical protein